MTERLHSIVLRTIRDHALVARGDRVAIALSGGADSVALLWLLLDLESRGALDACVAGVIHVNHQLRGDESHRDEQFCRDVALRAGVPIEVRHVDVPAAVRAQRRSVEAVARDLRYACFAHAAACLHANRVATAHTADDQAETVLLRLLRGAGTRGVSGIRIRRGAYIRPVLNCRRRDLRAYLAARGEPFCEDSSNSSLAVARNRVRHLLLPAIEQVTPSGAVALARFASHAAADERFLQEAADAACASVLVAEDDAGGSSSVHLDVEALTRLPAALQARVVRRLAEQITAHAGVSASSINAILRMCAQPRGNTGRDLPRLRVERRGPMLVMSRPSGPPVDVPFEVPLPVPGTAGLPSGLAVAAALEPGVKIGDLRAYSGTTAAIQASAVSFPLVVRSRRRGDRVQPFGAPGTRKLKDVLIDRKVPLIERDALPLVVDAAGRIVWIAGLTIAEHCRVTMPETGVVVLKLGRTSAEPDR